MRQAPDHVQKRWHTLMHRLGVNAESAQPVLEELVSAYTEPGRHYHTMHHIAALLDLLEHHGAHVTDSNAIELAIFFHDAVYVPTRFDNEAASAWLARAKLTALRLPQALVARVEQLVLATEHGRLPSEQDDADLALFLDLDLAVLATDPSAYTAYAQAIRAEYEMVPDEIYRQGRQRVLSHFLSRPRIYRTDRLHALWDAAARANLGTELARLA
jgi:predicted metal-dependent HD superfamily phosphohydrolase